MGRVTLPLTDRQIRNAKPKEKLYRLFDGNGLVLEVKPNGHKIWRQRYRFNGKEKTYTIGDYPSITLSKAREISMQLRVKIKAGIDPVLERRIADTDRKNRTFGDVVQEFLEYKRAELSPSYFHRVKRWMEIYILPSLQERDIDSVTKGDIVLIVKNVKTTDAPSTKKTDKTEVSRRVFNLLRQIFSFAVHNDYTEIDPTAQIDISKLVPKSETKNFMALTDPDEVKRLYYLISYEFRGYTIVGKALQFLALTALRPGNVTGLKWEYVDFRKEIIVFPANVMKMRREFWLPLTEGLLDLLESITYTKDVSEYVFCSPLEFRKPLSPNTLNMAHKRLGINNHNAHGWCSSFSTICYEKQKEHGLSAEVIETQLTHQIDNSVIRAYMRSNFLEERMVGGVFK